MSQLGSAIRPAFVMLIGLTLLTGIVYPLAVTGVGQVLLPAQANGSLVRDGDKIIGSAIIGQNFAKPEYFHPRPSAAGKDGYDASASSGSNLGPNSADLKTAIDERVAAARAEGVTGPIPADMSRRAPRGSIPTFRPPTRWRRHRASPRRAGSTLRWFVMWLPKRPSAEQSACSATRTSTCWRSIDN